MASFGIYYGCAAAAGDCTRPSDADDALDLAKDRLCTILHSDLFCSEKIRGTGARWALMAIKTSDCDNGEGGKAAWWASKP